MTYPDTLQQVGVPSRQAHHGGVGPGHPCIRYSVIEQSRGQVFHVCCDGQLTLKDVVRSGLGRALTMSWVASMAWLSGTSRGHSQAIAPLPSWPVLEGTGFQTRGGRGARQGPASFTSPCPCPG